MTTGTTDSLPSFLPQKTVISPTPHVNQVRTKTQAQTQQLLITVGMCVHNYHSCCLTCLQLYMIGENRQSVTNEPVEFEDSKRHTVWPFQSCFGWDYNTGHCDACVCFLGQFVLFLDLHLLFDPFVARGLLHSNEVGTFHIVFDVKRRSPLPTPFPPITSNI